MTEKKLIPVMRDTIFGEIEDCSEELLNRNRFYNG